MNKLNFNSRLAPRKPVLLFILDGLGINISSRHNAVVQAKPPKQINEISERMMKSVA
jgi:bisphosphoglycerate-independent phosphoglycerate mutase (AlkP superfamily)